MFTLDLFSDVFSLKSWTLKAPEKKMFAIFAHGSGTTSHSSEQLTQLTLKKNYL